MPRALRSSHTSPRWWELGVAFGLLPVLVGRLLAPAWWLPALWVIAALLWLQLWRERELRPQGFWAPVLWREAWADLRPILGRFAVAAVSIAALMLWFAPGRLLALPREKPALWAVLMIGYPALSVYPQELLYRRYFFHRYGGLFAGPVATVFASAIAFGWMHLIFRNALAVVFTVIGGWLFADTYRRSGSLRLTCFEHALYGNFIFTIGLGEFFYHGAVDVG